MAGTKKAKQAESTAVYITGFYHKKIVHENQLFALFSHPTLKGAVLINTTNNKDLGNKKKAFACILLGDIDQNSHCSISLTRLLLWEICAAFYPCYTIGGFQSIS